MSFNCDNETCLLSLFVCVRSFVCLTCSFVGSFALPFVLLRLFFRFFLLARAYVLFRFLSNQSVSAFFPHSYYTPAFDCSVEIDPSIIAFINASIKIFLRLTFHLFSLSLPCYFFLFVSLLFFFFNIFKWLSTTSLVGSRTFSPSKFASISQNTIFVIVSLRTNIFPLFVNSDTISAIYIYGDLVKCF